MSAAPRYDPAALYDPAIGIAGLLMSADQYLSLGEIPERTELVHGVVVMSPSPVLKHAEVAAEIVYQLKAFGRTTPGLRVAPETDVQFPAATVYRPDISVYNAGRLAAGAATLNEPPDLIVEVLSSGTRALDLITKRDDYERFGVREYWIVDPNDATIQVFRREGAAFVRAKGIEDSVSCGAVAGFILDLRPIRDIVFAR